MLWSLHQSVRLQRRATLRVLGLLGGMALPCVVVGNRSGEQKRHVAHALNFLGDGHGGNLAPGQCLLDRVGRIHRRRIDRRTVGNVRTVENLQQLLEQALVLR